MSDINDIETMADFYAYASEFIARITAPEPPYDTSEISKMLLKYNIE